MSRATPSRTDMELATWPEAAYIIVSLGDADVRAWRLAEGSPPESLELAITRSAHQPPSSGDPASRADARWATKSPARHAADSHDLLAA